MPKSRVGQTRLSATQLQGKEAMTSQPTEMDTQEMNNTKSLPLIVRKSLLLYLYMLAVLEERDHWRFQFLQLFKTESTIITNFQRLISGVKVSRMEQNIMSAQLLKTSTKQAVGMKIYPIVKRMI